MAARKLILSEYNAFLLKYNLEPTRVNKFLQQREKITRQQMGENQKITHIWKSTYVRKQQPITTIITKRKHSENIVFSITFDETFLILEKSWVLGGGYYVLVTQFEA